jgi:hypothetical protein
MMTPKYSSDLRPYYFQLPRENIVTLKNLIEIYEGLGIVRTLNRAEGEIVILALKDTQSIIEKLIKDHAEELQMHPKSLPPDVSEDWLLGEV